MKAIEALVVMLSRALDRAADWWWKDPLARARHTAEEEVRRLGGRVEWPQS
jgi:hypothetical protein